MAKGIDLSIAADTRSAMSAIQRGIIDPLEDVTELLEKTGTESKDAGRDLERSMRDAQRRTEDSKDEIRELRDELNKAGRAGKKTGSDIGRGMKDSADDMRKFGETSSEVGDELRQNLGETFSSFRGDLQDLPQIAQDTLGGLAGSGALGGIPGLAATAAGAAGLGLIIGAMDTMNAKTEELQGRAADMAQAFIEAGSTTLDALTIAASTAELTSDPEKRKRVQEYADALGVDFATAARAYVGDVNAMAAVDAIANDARAKSMDIADEQRKSLKALTPEQQATVEQTSKIVNTQKELHTVVADATSQFNDQQAVLLGLIRDAGKSAVEVDNLGNKLVTLPDGAQILIDADTGVATTKLDKFQGDADGVIDHVNGKEIVLKARADMSYATAQYNKWIKDHDGKSIKIGTRVITPDGGWNG